MVSLAQEVFEGGGTFIVGDLELWLDSASSDDIVDFVVCGNQ